MHATTHRLGCASAQPAHDPNLLETIARRVDHLSAGRPSPAIVAAVIGDGHVDIHHAPIDHHPAELLCGFPAPRAWWVLGVVADGTATTTAQDASLAGADAPRRRVRFTRLIARDGTGVGLLRNSNGRVELLTADADERGGGRIDDLVRRALGLPTAPPAASTVELDALIWLDRIMRLAAGLALPGQRWASLMVLHPAFDEGEPPADIDRWDVANLVRAARLRSDRRPWLAVQRDCAADRGPSVGVAPDLAAWHDVGSFSRAALTSFGPSEDLLADLHELLAPPVHRQLVDAAAALGLLGLFDTPDAADGS